MIHSNLTKTVLLLLASTTCRTSQGLSLDSITHAFKTAQDRLIGKSALSIGFISIAGDISTAGPYVDQIRKLAQDDTINGLFLHINSGGGSPASAEIIVAELLAFRANKPVIVFIETLCASAAYFIACAADWVFAQSTSGVGSIGVVWSAENTERVVHVTAGKFKRAHFDKETQLSSEHLAYMQEVIDEDYEIFCAHVANMRNLTISEVKATEARIFPGTIAFKLGLIDQIGTLNDAANKFKELLAEGSDTSYRKLIMRDSTGKKCLAF